MEHAKQEWIDRYLYDVVKRLPEKQRKDIEEELRTLIEDMLEERAENGKTESTNIREVLEQLGKPAELAAKYQGTERHLIGGQYYEVFCQVLKIILICVAAGMGITAAVNAFVFLHAGQIDSIDSAVRYLTTDFIVSLAKIPAALLQAFGIITLIFVLMERNQVKLDSRGQAFTVDSLQPVPYRKAAISRGDCIAGIVFAVLAAVLFISAPQFMGAYIKSENGTIVNIPVFNMAVWNQVLPLFLLAFFAGVLDDLVKLISGYYSIAVMWTTIAAEAVGIVTTFIIFKGYEIWNPDFARDISAATGRTFTNKYDIMANWNDKWLAGLELGDILILIVVFACLLDICITVYRTVRYGMRKEE